jgi:hypothetical protein
MNSTKKANNQMVRFIHLAMKNEKSKYTNFFQIKIVVRLFVLRSYVKFEPRGLTESYTKGMWLHKRQTDIFYFIMHYQWSFERPKGLFLMILHLIAMACDLLSKKKYFINTTEIKSVIGSWISQFLDP